MGSRTKARECALQALYQLDTSGGTPADVLAGLWAHFEPVDEDTKAFAEALVRGAQREQAAIDQLLQRADVPVKVTLNEAIELSKKYGSEDSSAFVNGILDRIANSSGLPGQVPKQER